MTTLVFVLLLSPLLGVVWNGLARGGIYGTGGRSTVFCLLAFLVSLGMFFTLSPGSSVQVSFGNWISVGDFQSRFSFLVDPLSMVMLLLVTGVGTLIHLFSIYYMSEDKNPARYFCYLGLFVFSMMVLVLAEDLLVMFVGWEAVGLCSYLLIGFWYQNLDKAACGMKAFLLNRLGDMGFLLALFLLIFIFQSLSVTELKQSVSLVDPHLKGLIKWACLFLLVGACGKSAQGPLYMWLPSAMAGPTPASALIHAATMVTAGIYMMVRLDFLFHQAPGVLSLVAYTGALGAFLAAVVASAQTDIKKVLAYSTVSQLGYMFLAVGLYACVPAIFHLLTHGFFKALLFLVAGVVIHTLHGEQSIHRMGGLAKKMPLTTVCFVFGGLALVGLPPFSGFFSKDEILWQSLQAHPPLFVLASLTALISAFYMTRLFVLVFLKSPHPSLSPLPPAPEGAFSLKVPLGILAFLSLAGGLMGIPHLLGDILPFHPPHFLEGYLKPVLAPAPPFSRAGEGVFMLLSSVCVLLVVVLTLWLYVKKPYRLKDLRKKHSVLCEPVSQAFGVDAFCQKKVAVPVLSLSRELFEVVDQNLLQGGVEWIQKWLVSLQKLFESFQNKKIQSYFLYMILGVIVLILSMSLY